MIDPVDWSYVAGLFDGKGTLIAQICKNKAKKTGRYSLCFCPQIILVNTNIPAADRIRFLLENEGIECWRNIVGAHKHVAQLMVKRRKQADKQIQGRTA